MSKPMVTYRCKKLIRKGKILVSLSVKRLIKIWVDFSFLRLKEFMKKGLSCTLLRVEYKH